MDLKSYITEYVSSGRGRKKSDFNQISEYTGFDEFLKHIQSEGYTENKQMTSIHPGASKDKSYHIYRNKYMDSSVLIGILNPDKPDYIYTVFFDEWDDRIIRVEKYRLGRFMKSRTVERKQSSIEELIDYLS